MPEHRQHTSPDPIRILVVDADRRVRQSMSGLIALAEGIEAVAVTGDGGSALELVDAYRPDIVLIDPRLPDLDGGLALIATLRRAWPEIGIVAMSCADSLEHPSLGRGADAFVAKGGQTEELLEAVIRAACARPRVDGAPATATIDGGEPDGAPAATTDAVGTARPAWVV